MKSRDPLDSPINDPLDRLIDEFARALRSSMDHNGFWGELEPAYHDIGRMVQLVDEARREPDGLFKPYLSTEFILGVMNDLSEPLLGTAAGKSVTQKMRPRILRYFNEDEERELSALLKQENSHRFLHMCRLAPD